MIRCCGLHPGVVRRASGAGGWVRPGVTARKSTHEGAAVCGNVLQSARPPARLGVFFVFVCRVWFCGRAAVCTLGEQRVYVFLLRSLSTAGRRVMKRGAPAQHDTFSSHTHTHTHTHFCFQTNTQPGKLPWWIMEEKVMWIHIGLVNMESCNPSVFAHIHTHKHTHTRMSYNRHHTHTDCSDPFMLSHTTVDATVDPHLSWHSSLCGGLQASVYYKQTRRRQRNESLVNVFDRSEQMDTPSQSAACRWVHGKTWPTPPPSHSSAIVTSLRGEQRQKGHL